MRKKGGRRWRESEEKRKGAKTEEGRRGRKRRGRAEEDVHYEQMLAAASFTAYEMGTSRITLCEVWVLQIR